MNLKLSTSAVDMALQIYHTPAGALYVAMRHGRMKRCFSRDTAIRYLAFFMTSRAFSRSGFRERHPDTLVDHPEHGEVWQRGAVTREYELAHWRTIRRIRQLLARKREIVKWQKNYDAATQQIAQLLSEKPY